MFACAVARGQRLEYDVDARIAGLNAVRDRSSIPRGRSPRSPYWRTIDRAALTTGVGKGVTVAATCVCKPIVVTPGVGSSPPSSPPQPATAKCQRGAGNKMAVTRDSGIAGSVVGVRVRRMLAVDARDRATVDSGMLGGRNATHDRRTRRAAAAGRRAGRAAHYGVARRTGMSCPAAFVTPVSIDPPLIGVAVHPARHTHDMIKFSEEFALNIPTQELLHHCQYLGSVSGTELNKLELTRLPTFAARKVEAPLLEGCVGWIECGVEDAYRIGDHTFFVGKVAAASAEQDAFAEAWLLADPEERPLHYLGVNYLRGARGAAGGAHPSAGGYQARRRGGSGGTRGRRGVGAEEGAARGIAGGRAPRRLSQTAWPRSDNRTVWTSSPSTMLCRSSVTRLSDNLFRRERWSNEAKLVSVQICLRPGALSRRPGVAPRPRGVS